MARQATRVLMSSVRRGRRLSWAGQDQQHDGKGSVLLEPGKLPGPMRRRWDDSKCIALYRKQLACQLWIIALKPCIENVANCRSQTEILVAFPLDDVWEAAG